MHIRAHTSKIQNGWVYYLQKLLLLLNINNTGKRFYIEKNKKIYYFS
jgi:hypothetical protein